MLGRRYSEQLHQAVSVVCVRNRSPGLARRGFLMGCEHSRWRLTANRNLRRAKTADAGSQPASLLSEVLLHADGEDAILYAQVAQLGAELLDDSVARLEQAA